MRGNRRGRRAWLGLVPLALAGALVAGWTQKARTPLYCIERPGTVWNGLFPLPAGLTPLCPQSNTYRREVRTGQSRVEQYRVRGWQPLALRGPLERAGYRRLDDEIGGPNHYSVFMGRAAPAELFYTAVLDGSDTLITLSGK